MNAQLEQLQARVRGQLDQLQPRERLMVLAGGAVLLVVIFYLALWEPLLLAGKRRADELDSARALAVRIESAASLAQSGRAGGAVDRGTPIVSVVDQSSRGSTLGVPPTRVQPEGNGDKAVKVWFENVPFDNTVRWLGELQARYAVTVSSAEIEPGSAPGTVTARFTLSR
ncbi:type II secretion system protein GspM [Solimonas soli]|uniref:type II secretion system protein GspM n=1 Tax=Solimonas soli TaxID=413479 RepID=UPI000482F408|nr:type II secretion system protein M [Solimonas soli]